MSLHSTFESGKKNDKKKCIIYKLLQIFTNIFFYICRYVKLPALQKQVEKRTKSKQTSEESLDSPKLKSPAGRGGGGAPRGRGTRRSSRTSAALAQQGITATD